MLAFFKTLGILSSLNDLSNIVCNGLSTMSAVSRNTLGCQLSWPIDVQVFNDLFAS